MVYQSVSVPVGKARDEARRILDHLETQQHAQTGQAAALYLGLGALHGKLFAFGPPPSIAVLIFDLERLVRDCVERLAPVKPFIEEALRIARGD